MRSLNFFAMGQNLQKDPTCDFSGLVKGSKGYLQAHFSFDAEWTGCGKVAVFTRLGKEYPAKLSADTCMIPEEALSYSRLHVHVIGVRDGFRIQTNDVELEQEG